MKALLHKPMFGIACGLMALIPASSLRAQENRPAPMQRRPEQDRPIRVDVRLMLLPVTVVDEASGQFVNGLRQEQFTVLEDKKRQSIVAFSTEDSLCSVGLLFDISGSMEHKVQKARLAMAHLFEVLNPQDEAFLLTFADHPESRTEFTSRFQTLQDPLLFEKATGQTALVDAVYLGLQRMRNAKNPRRALVVISDGGDNNSRYSTREFFQYATESDVQVYALGVKPYPYGTFLLDAMAEVTGGLSFTVDKLKNLDDAMNAIGRALHEQYLIGYYPPNTPLGRKWRKLQIQVSPLGERQRLRAYTKSGYFGPE